MHTTGIILLCILILFLVALSIGFASVGAMNFCAAIIVINLILIIATVLLHMHKVIHW